MAQVSIMATGRGAHFWDLSREEQVESLAVCLHRRTEEGSRGCVLPASAADLAHTWNATRPRKKKGDDGGAGDYLGGA